MPIPLPQPCMVIPIDGSDPKHIHEADPTGPPILTVCLVTPYIAQKWLHAGEPVFHPVVITDTDRQLVAGRAVLEAATIDPEATKAAIVMIGEPQAETAWTAVQAMRMAFQLPEADDVPGLVLDEDGGRVLGGGSALYDLRKPTVMIVLITTAGVTQGQFN